MPGLRLPRSVFAIAFLALASTLAAQAPHPLTPAEQQRVDSLVHRMSLDQKLDYIGGTGFAIRPVPPLDIPAIEMSDGPFGVRSTIPSTTYAAGINLAASWDPALAARVGAAIGRDARARGIHFMLGPGVNIYRSPRNGRNFEYFGEDPFLASETAVGYITGMQQQGVSATVKHYIGNNSEYLRHDSDTIIDQRTLREIYLPAFDAAVTRAHVGAIMDSYNLIDGTHATQNPTFNIDIARREWRFPGVIMSDWNATYDAVAAANGGLDLEMPTGKFMNRANLESAVRAGTVPEASIDDKIRRILSTAVSFGWLDRVQTDPSISLDDARNRATALDSAREGIVLLKNTGALLPLDKARVKTILVTGPDAYPGVPVGGGSAGVVPFHNVSLLEALSEKFGSSVNVLYDAGLPTLSQLATQTDFQTAPSGGKPGLTLETFRNPALAGPPATTSTVQHINSGGLSRDTLENNPDLFAGPDSGGAGPISRRYTGFFTPSAAGQYLLALGGEGEGTGSRVLVDGKLVIDNWKIVRAFQPHVTLALSVSPHKIVVETWQRNRYNGRIRFGIAAEDAIVNAHATQLATKADVVIVAAGYQSNADNESEGEAGDRTFDLPFGQDQLIRAMASANQNTIVTVTSGGNVDSATWLDRVPALLEDWYPGEEGGRALAEILFGDINPSGHLPATFERRAQDKPTFDNYYPEPGTNRVVYREGIFVGYRGYEHNHVKPLFPFGYGLSYTTFRFSGLTAAQNPRAGTFDVTVRFSVTNTGTRSGAEVAQVYVSDDHAPVPRPAHELKGFQRVELAPGETRQVSIQLDARAFAFYDVAAKKWTIDPGKFTIHAGDSVESLPLVTKVEIDKKTAATAF